MWRAYLTAYGLHTPVASASGAEPTLAGTGSEKSQMDRKGKKTETQVSFSHLVSFNFKYRDHKAKGILENSSC